MYRLKQQSDDFIVKEIFSPKLEGGDYIYVEMTKKNYNTIDAINTIARKLNVNQKLKMEHVSIKDVFSRKYVQN